MHMLHISMFMLARTTEMPKRIYCWGQDQIEANVDRDIGWWWWPKISANKCTSMYNDNITQSFNYWTSHSFVRKNNNNNNKKSTERAARWLWCISMELHQEDLRFVLKKIKTIPKIVKKYSERLSLFLLLPFRTFSQSMPLAGQSVSESPFDFQSVFFAHLKIKTD